MCFVVLKVHSSPDGGGVKGFISTGREIYKLYGSRGFFRGIWLNLAKAGPSQAIQFTAYGYLKEKFITRDDDP